MLISLIIALIIVGGFLYLISLPGVPISPFFKQVIYVVVIIALLVWLLKTFGHYVL